MFENYKSKLDYNNINSIKPKSGYSGHVPKYKFVYGITRYDHWNKNNNNQKGNNLEGVDNNLEGVNQKGNDRGNQKINSKEFVLRRNKFGNRLFFS